MTAFEGGLAVYAALHAKNVWDFVLRFWKYALVLVVVSTLIVVVLKWSGLVSLHQHFTEKKPDPAKVTEEVSGEPVPAGAD